MTTQTEAERLADALEHWAKEYATTDFDGAMGEQSAAELRRLVSFNQQLMDEVARLQKPWVGLTDEDVKEIREQCDSIVTLHAIKAIEAKLKEKNT